MRILRTDILIPGLYFAVVAPLALFVFFAEGTHMTPTLLLPFATPWWIVTTHLLPAVDVDHIRDAWRMESIGYLIGSVEQLELGELQGVQGLRALRVQVALDNPKLQDRINLEELQVTPH